MADLRERLAGGVKASFVAQATRAGVNAALVVLLSRYLLDPTGYGRLFFALSVVSVVGLFASLGLPKSAARYVVEYAESDPPQVRHVLRRSFAWLLGLGLAVGIALAAASGPLARLLGQPAVAPLLAVGGGYVLVRSLSSYCSVVFQGLNRVVWSARLTVVSNLGRLGFVVVLVSLGFGATGALAGYVVGFALAVAVGLAVLYRTTYRTLDRAPAKPGLSRRLAEYSLPLAVTKGANVVDKRADTVIVGVLLNATAVSYYTVAKQVADFAAMPVASLGFTVSPALGDEAAGGRRERAARLYHESLRHVLLLYVPAAAGLALVAGPLVTLVLGSAYAGAVPVLRVFAGFVAVNAVNKITNDGLDFLGRARSRAAAQGTMAATNIALTLWLVPLVGVVGAAVATVLTYGSYTAANVYFIHEELGTDPATMASDLLWSCVVAAGVALAVLALLPYVGSLPTLAGVIAAGAAVWAVLAVAFGLLDPGRVARLLGGRGTSGP
ncbi:flippase [Halosegnis marinus]|uniref:Flippase n=1 Tax=Halosegnis marinus TaxID=3034023 RepID=A0ABD5ZRQ4_9EURY|nr:flippase [Halosegnis sp. DT85]